MNTCNIWEAYRPGEVYLCSIPYATGHEILKDRPAVIVSDEGLNASGGVVWVVMCSASDHEGRENCIPVSGLERKSWAICGQIYAVDKSRLLHYITSLPAEELEAIRRKVCDKLGGARQEKTMPGNRAEDLVKVTAERDTYKELYTSLLGRVVRGVLTREKAA